MLLIIGTSIKQYAFSARSFHVVNAPMLFSVGYNILKPFLTDEYKVEEDSTFWVLNHRDGEGNYPPSRLLVTKSAAVMDKFNSPF